jgi:membrane protein
MKSAVLERWSPVVRDAFRGLSQDRGRILGAALAYYTVFSIAPLFLIAIAAAGAFFGAAARAQIFESLRALIGTNAARAMEAVASSAAQNRQTGIITTIVGVLTLLVGASGVFRQLQESLNIIWKASAPPEKGFLRMLRRQLLSYSMVLAIMFLLLVSLLLSTTLATVTGFLGKELPGGPFFWHAVNFLSSFALVSVLFGAIFKILPDVRLRWRDALLGGAATSFLFTIGKSLISLYLGHAALTSVYGATGSFIVVLLWVFYSSEILFFGAELTRAYVTRAGRLPRLDVRATNDLHARHGVARASTGILPAAAPKAATSRRNADAAPNLPSRPPSRRRLLFRAVRPPRRTPRGPG